MAYYEVANHVTVTQTNMIDEMPCAYGTLRTTVLRIRHQVFHRAGQRSQLLQNLTRTHSDQWSQSATMPQCSFTREYWQSKKNWRNCDGSVICNVMRGIGTGRRVICHWGLSDSSDGARPLWRSHSAQTEMFFADGSVCRIDATSHMAYCTVLHSHRGHFISDLHSVIIDEDRLWYSVKCTWAWNDR